MNRPAVSQSGFTILELASVVLVSGILAMSSIPLVKSYAKDVATNGAHEQFTKAVASARSSAVSLGKSVAVCASVDGKQCSNGDWENGWLTYVEEGANKGFDIPPALLLDYHSIDGYDINLDVFDEALQPVAAIRFGSNGFNLSGHRIAATMCPKLQQHKTQNVLIERTGRIRLSGSLGDDAAPNNMNCYQA